MEKAKEAFEKYQKEEMKIGEQVIQFAILPLTRVKSKSDSKSKGLL